MCKMRSVGLVVKPVMPVHCQGTFAVCGLLKLVYMPGVEGNTLRCELGCRLCLKIGRQGGRRAEH